ncbi:GntR family transcriptional regulator [Rothia uropygialis]|uniref:GntR family transcriptional regulator n=1 Tax=Kocuria sp. 36 TaxID=1415402 RepID=UPI0013EA26A5|nr:GntR family transcriptional regulator [Kocuria sp. 36]
MPKYLSLAAALETDVVAAGEPHQVLPTERSLQEEYGVSRATVRRAIAHLIASGAVYSVRGSGTYIADPSVIRKGLRLTSFSEDMDERGHRPSSETLGNDVVAADEDLAERLNVAVGEDLARIHRLRLADGLPMALELACIPLTFFGGILPDPGGSLDEQLSRRGHRVEFADQSIRAVNLGFEEATLLSQPVGAAALRVERQARDALGRLVECTETTYRADRYGFDLSVVRESKD